MNYKLSYHFFKMIIEIRTRFVGWDWGREMGAGDGGGRWGREMGAGDGAGGSLSAKEIFVCEGDLCLRRRSLSAKEIFLCGGDLSLLW